MRKFYLIIFTLIFYSSYSQYEGFSKQGWEKQKEIDKLLYLKDLGHHG